MNKFKSRKFIAMIAGILTGVGVIISGQTTEGLTAVIVSIISYLAAEGYIDSSAVKSISE